MKNTFLKLSSFVVLLLLVLGPVTSFAETSADQKLPLIVATGGSEGDHFQVGEIICRIAKKGALKNDRACRRISGRSIENIYSLRRGDVDFVILPTDWQERSYTGSALVEFPNGPYDHLRKIFSLSAEYFSIYVRKESTIRSFLDLKDQRVNFGVSSSETRELIDQILAQAKMTYSDFKSVDEYSPLAQITALCEEKIDAISFKIGHPSFALKEKMKECDLRRIIDSILFVVRGKDIFHGFVNGKNAYAVVGLAGKAGTAEEAMAFGLSLGSGLVTSADMDANLVYKLVKSTFNHLENFKKMHPSLKRLTIEEMIKDGGSVPFHEGALRYYKEKGWK